MNAHFAKAPEKAPPQGQDADLIRRCLAGDPAAQTEFVGRFKAPLFRRLVRMTRSYDLAEDLTQEALVRALTKLHMFRENVTLDGWVHRIATNLMRDHFRAEKVRLEKSLEQSYAAAGPAPVGSDDEIIANEERLAVAAAVSDLPDTYREVIMLAHYEDQSVQDIAEKLGLGLSAVKMRLQRGRALLFKALEKLYD